MPGMTGEAHMNRFRTLDDVDVKGKRVLLRVDLNVPMENGRVTDATRLERVGPTIAEISDKGGRAILLAHFGRPKGRDAKDSLRPVAAELAHILKKPVGFSEGCIGEAAEKAVAAMKDGDILCLENTRFHKEEEKNDPAFVASLAKLGDIWVNDAFSAAHRAHASTEGLGRKLPAYAGRTMQAELDALDKALEAPTKPVVAVIGGARSPPDRPSREPGQQGRCAGDRRRHGQYLPACARASASASRWRKRTLPRPRCGSLKRPRPPTARSSCQLTPWWHSTSRPIRRRTPTASMRSRPIGMILDVGPRSIARIHAAIDDAATLVWNGPLGAFEMTPFDRGTVLAAKHAAERTKAKKLISVAGGGDTVAALNQAGVSSDFSYVSTAGGAFLEWMEGKPLPGVEVLKTR